MTIKKLILSLLIGIFCSLSLYGCEFVFDGQMGNEKVISGTVTYDDSPLENVAIRSNSRIFAYTDSNGEFSFKTKLENIEIYAEKTSYAFSARYTLLASMDNANFIATKIEELSGQLTLEKVYITPTSILDLVGHSFNYGTSSACLKLANIDVIYNNETISLLQEDKLADKYHKNAFEVIDADSIDYPSDKLQQVKVRLQAYFTLQSQEAVASEENWVTINLSNLSTINLNEEGKVLIYVYAINSAYNGFTYNLALEFGYTPTILE